MARILVVDDSPTQIAHQQMVLKKHQHEVIVAENGLLAVELTQTLQPDLVLMDIVMPELSGFQATRQITSNPKTSHIPIILVSSKNQETDKLWGKRQGAKAYIVKPVKEELLIKVVEYLLNPVKDEALSEASIS